MILRLRGTHQPAKSPDKSTRQKGVIIIQNRDISNDISNDIINVVEPIIDDPKSTSTPISLDSNYQTLFDLITNLTIKVDTGFKETLEIYKTHREEINKELECNRNEISSL